MRGTFGYLVRSGFIRQRRYSVVHIRGGDNRWLRKDKVPNLTCRRQVGQRVMYWPPHVCNAQYALELSGVLLTNSNQRKPIRRAKNVRLIRCPMCPPAPGTSPGLARTCMPGWIMWTFHKYRLVPTMMRMPVGRAPVDQVQEQVIASQLVMTSYTSA